MNLQRLPILAATFAVLLLGTGGPIWAQDDDTVDTTVVEVYRAQLTGLNNSSASGEAIVSREGDQLTVIIYAEGLETGQTHPQHIHGFEDDRTATCPTLEQDDDGDNLIQVAEGRDTYGPIQLPLMPFPVGQPNPENTEGSTAIPPRGDVTFVNTYTVGPDGDVSEDAVTPFVNKHIVLHGITVDGVYETTLPAVCGQLVELPHQDGGGNPEDNGEAGDRGDNNDDDAGNDDDDVFNGSDGGCTLWDDQGSAPAFDPLLALLLLVALAGLFRVRRRQ